MFCFCFCISFFFKEILVSKQHVAQNEQQLTYILWLISSEAIHTICPKIVQKMDTSALHGLNVFPSRK